MTVLTPRFLQQRGYSAKDLRNAILGPAFHYQEQVLYGLATSPAGALTVSVSAGAAIIRGDTNADQGFYSVENASAEVVSVTPNASGNPRVDRVIMRLYDAFEAGGVENKGEIQVVAGTPIAGATLANLIGAPALPPSAITLAYILRPSGDAVVDATEILDARPYDTSGFEAGDIKVSARSAASNGWLLCDGANVSRTTYGNLFRAIGTTYGGGDGITTFTLPNLKGRVPMGRDTGQAEFDVLGEAGGAKTVTLTEAQIAAHIHGDGSLATAPITIPRQNMGVIPGNSNHYVANPSYNAVDGWENLAARDVTGNTGSAGGNQPHANLPPYQVLNYMIKT